MKSRNLTALFIAVLLAFSAGAQEKNKMVSYGPKKVDPKKAVSVTELVSQMENTKEKKEFTFEGEITQVCSKAGCWVSVKKADGSTFRVRFKDHFTIPMETAVGTKAYFHGTAYWDTISVEMLRHFAEDAGKSKEEIAKITEPKYEFAFTADGVTFGKPAR